MREARHGFEGVDLAAHFGVADVHHLGGRGHNNIMRTRNVDSTRDKEDEEQEVKENNSTVGTTRRVRRLWLSEQVPSSCRRFRVLQALLLLCSFPELFLCPYLIGIYLSTF